MRLMAIPGPRSRRIVTMKLIAPAVVKMVRNISASAKKSIPGPGEKA
jgi:hypothetical protein